MSQLKYVFPRIVLKLNNGPFLDGCVDLCANDFLQPYKSPQIESKTKSTVILNHIHKTIEWTRDMRLQQILDMGRYQDKTHNSKKWGYKL